MGVASHAQNPARRIWIRGTSGSGKSTLAARLAQHLAVPHVELDALHHGPRWKPATALELHERLGRALAGHDGWVVDGNYDSKLEVAFLADADLIVWLDLPLRTKMIRLARRSFRRWVSREELWNGNRERLVHLFAGRDALFIWALKTHFRHRRLWPAKFDGWPLARLSTPREVERWFLDFTGSGE